jgi:hypothetical protein
MPEQVPAPSSAFATVLAAIDAANAADPRRAVVRDTRVPAESLYSERMSAWLARLAPEAPELLRIAVRAQHLERWKLPRERYPRDRAGYHAWRRACAGMHAARAGELMAAAGYGDADIARVGALIRKENLRRDPEAQILEDCAALTFLEFYFDSFLDSADLDEEKVVDIVRRTWRKMSHRGQAAATALLDDLPPRPARLVRRALGT